MNDRPESHAVGAGRQSPPDLRSDARFDVPFVFRLRFTENVFDPQNRTLASVIESSHRLPARVAVLIDEGVLDASPELLSRIGSYFEANREAVELVADPSAVAGGERAKGDSAVVERTQQLINDHGICRQSYIVAIGGGAMLDAVGYGAATAHRGVRLIRVPTTTLAQADAGIGVKNGINAFGKKNFLGTFAVPWAVINDSTFLNTLSDRDWRCGLSEAVKVALVKDASYFEQIERAAGVLRQRDERELQPILDGCAELHLRHITEGGDPFELTAARPLDFGHWSAHKLEQITNFDLRHGEAVAIGLAIDVTYAAMKGMLTSDATRRVVDCLFTLGFELSHPALAETDALLEGIEEFREHLGGRLTIALIDSIGHQVDVHEIDRDLMVKAIRRVNSCEV